MNPAYHSQPVGYAQPMTSFVHSPTVTVTNNDTNQAMQYKSTFKTLGIIQVVIGVLCVILAVVSLGLISQSIYTYSASGIWAGVWYVTTGSLAIASGQQPNNCNVTAGLVLSIIATIVAFIALIIDALTATAWTILGSPMLTGIHGCLSVLSGVEFVVAIVHSAFCCKGGCGRSHQGHVIVSNTVTTVPVAHIQHQNLPGQQPIYPVATQPSQ